MFDTTNQSRIYTKDVTARTELTASRAPTRRAENPNILTHKYLQNKKYTKHYTIVSYEWIENEGANASLVKNFEQ